MTNYFENKTSQHFSLYDKLMRHKDEFVGRLYAVGAQSYYVTG